MKLLYISLFFFAANAFSEQAKPESSPILDGAYASHSFVSKQILILTNYFDSFFGDKKNLEVHNGSALRFYHITTKSEGAKVENEFAYSFNLGLPNLQRKLQLSIEKNSDTQIQATTQQEGALQTEAGRDNESTRVGVGVLLKPFLNWNVKLTGGVKAQLPPIPFAQLLFSRVIEIGKWNMRLVPRFFWNKQDSYGQSFTADFDRRLSKFLLFRFSNEQTWLDNDQILRTSHGPSLFQSLTDKISVSYNIRALFSDDPNFRLLNYNASISYRQNILKRWLFYEVIPSLGISKRDFNLTPSASIKFELVFGSI